ncbi:hypothetical protein CEXT_604331 [Caerostris extrusa]|uniref:Uncharacterized protein n=1 Tax=Caerostris extrusa TaxID=172846 RepID=A0AAV4MFP4_CAEEX|nr:hypothetical protein CEXT_604331 [Caerostris extrusa]
MSNADRRLLNGLLEIMFQLRASDKLVLCEPLSFRSKLVAKRPSVTENSSSIDAAIHRTTSEILNSLCDPLHLGRRQSNFCSVTLISEACEIPLKAYKRGKGVMEAKLNLEAFS